MALAARRVKLLDQVADECRALGGEALVIPTDVTDEIQCRKLIEKTIKQYGRLDMLVNNAGLTVISLLEEYKDLTLFKHNMDVNFYGAVYCTYYALPHLIQSHGRIIAVSSLGGKGPLPYNTAYIASKFAMHGFFDSLRMELKRHDVSVTIICPSWVMTGFHEAQLDKEGKPRGSRGRAIYSKNTMTAERCAEITLKAATNRQREVVMGPGVILSWLKLIAPGFLDWFIVKVFLGSAARRVRANQAKEKP